MQYLSQFQKDNAWNTSLDASPAKDLIKGQIEGCQAISLHANSDHRGHLIELLTSRHEPTGPVPHIYQVFAEPHSVRAWIYHAVQTDRLCFTNGLFRIVLFDLREDSPTFERRVELLAGEDEPIRLIIPPFVAHGVQNLGTTRGSYVNMPDRVYNLESPDKYRVPADSSILSFDWDPLCLQS